MDIVVNVLNRVLDDVRYFSDTIEKSDVIGVINKINKKYSLGLNNKVSNIIEFKNISDMKTSINEITDDRLYIEYMLKLINDKELKMLLNELNAKLLILEINYMDRSGNLKGEIASNIIKGKKI